MFDQAITIGRLIGENKKLVAEVERLRDDYALFEELSPPDVPRATFVAWCFRAWEEANEARAASNETH